MRRRPGTDTELQWRSLAALEALEGRIWKEVASEFHGSYAEVAIWILLFDDGDLAEAHEHCRSVLAPFLAQAGRTRFTVSYLRLTDTETLTLAFLDGNDAVAAPLDPDAIGPPSVVPRRPSVFRSRDSRRG